MEHYHTLRTTDYLGFYEEDFDLSCFDIDDFTNVGELSQQEGEFSNASKNFLSLNFLSNDILVIVETNSGYSNSRIVRSAKCINGSKLKARTLSVRTRKKASPFRKGMTVSQALTEGAKMPNMSRRAPTNVLIAFPSFDKCDSLIYFPSTLTRLINSDDMRAASKLFATHCSKDCVIDYVVNVGDTATFTPKTFVGLLQVANILEPDKIMCVHSTKVIGNQIRATVNLKLTDTQPLYDYMSKTLSTEDPAIASVCQHDRGKRLKYYIHDELMSDSAKQDIINHSDSQNDLLVYIQCNLVMTIDDIAKKISHINMTYVVTSLQPVSNGAQQT